MSETPEMIERVARAIDAAYPFLSDGIASMLTQAAIAAHRAALADAGLVIVPREPTEAMLSAGDCMMPQIAEGEDITTGYDALKEAWPAMVTVALSE